MPIILKQGDYTTIKKRCFWIYKIQTLATELKERQEPILETWEKENESKGGKKLFEEWGMLHKGVFNE